MPDRCSSCGAEVRWALTEGGRFMPLNADPDPRGEWQLAAEARGHAPRALYVREDRRAQFKRELMMTHWATCPFADDHRRSQ